MGILDQKTRILDTILTAIGKEMLPSGLKIKYYSFSDYGTFYEEDAISGSTNVADRISLECSSSPSDYITFSPSIRFEAENQSVSFKDGSFIVKSTVFDSVSKLTGSTTNYTSLSGTSFYATASAIINQISSNIKKNMFLSTDNSLFDDEDFKVSTDSTKFTITNDKPLKVHKKTIDELGTLFQDPRLAHFTNFLYLPPVNKGGTHIGSYKRLSEYDPLSVDALNKELDLVEKSGYKRTITFDETSVKNNLLIQVFGMSDTVLTQLDIIHFGNYVVNNKLFDYYFVGKVIESDGVNTFAHLFTIVFELCHITSQQT